MSLSTLSGDVQGMILDQLRNALEPRLVMYFSSASKELRALLTPAMQQQLRADYEEATALCLKNGIWSCKDLREATKVDWGLIAGVLSESDLTTLAKLGSVLPALKLLTLADRSAGRDGVQRLAEGLVAGALPALDGLVICAGHMGDAGASALAAALDRGALPQVAFLTLGSAAIGDAALVALAPALRRRPALEKLILPYNPFGDEGLAALVAPPDGAAAGTTGALAKLKVLGLDHTQISDAGCNTLVAALDSDALPALEEIHLDGCAASDVSRAAVTQALKRSMNRAEMLAAGAVAFASVLALALAIPIVIALRGMALLGAQPRRAPNSNPSPSPSPSPNHTFIPTPTSTPNPNPTFIP